MKLKIKSQVSFEFIIIFSMTFFVLVTFFYIMNSRMEEINEQQELSSMRDISNNIKTEVILAVSVSNNYLRRFNLPTRINGKEYRMNIENDELVINLLENNRSIREFFSVLPTHTKGNFIDNINYTNREHCITKSNFDGIRIARNQASLDSASPEVFPDETFDVFVSLNCVEDVRSAQFTITYNQDILELIKSDTVPITYENKELSPLFEDAFVLGYEDQQVVINKTSYPYVDDSIGRYTYGLIGRNCATGSGNIAKLSFRARAGAPPGMTVIEFDRIFGDQNLVILDCTTNKFTQDSIPDSKNSALVEIIEP